VEEISELALRWLTGREWPGNVAELENVIQRGVIMARGKAVEEGDLIPADYVAQGLPYAAPDIFSLPLPEAEERLLASFVREYLRKSLARTRGDVAAAAAQAGVSKADFARLIKEYELEVLGAFGK
jgi:two-component system response regulator GlrR